MQEPVSNRLALLISATEAAELAARNRRRIADRIGRAMLDEGMITFRSETDPFTRDETLIGEADVDHPGRPRAQPTAYLPPLYPRPSGKKADWFWIDEAASLPVPPAPLAPAPDSLAGVRDWVAELKGQLLPGVTGDLVLEMLSRHIDQLEKETEKARA